MSDVACFFLEPHDRARRSLRRYTYREHTTPSCSQPYGHDARVFLDEIPARKNDQRIWDFAGADDPSPLRGDPRWPATCESCGWTFDDRAERQVFMEPLYRRSDTGEILTLKAAPPGAMWNADWLSAYDEWRGPDGRVLVCRCPDGHDWTIDGRASNCDSPCASCAKPYHQHYGQSTPPTCERYVESRPHKCWVRHGEPPTITVDKAGVTCGAGAGSIQTPKWHGFLRSGRLVQ